MKKEEFLARLRQGLSGLPQDEIEERLSFYSEMIDDRMEEGLPEAEAVAAAGSVEEIAAQAVADIPLAKLAKERIRPKRRLRALEIVLLVLGAPLWLSLGIAAVAVGAALYVSVWAVIVSFWAVFAAFGVSAAGGAVLGAVLAAGIVCAGLGIFSFFGCRAASKGVLVLTKNAALRLKGRFVRKEGE